MWMTLSRLTSRAFGTRPAGGGRRPPPRFRPALQPLEGRLVPATILVTTRADVVNPADHLVSLREAVTRANELPGTDTIVLPAGIYRIALTGADDTNAAGDFDVTDGTVFRGAGAGATFIDGRRLDRVFDVRGTSPSSIAVTFQGLTVRNGLADAGGGGGIQVGDADLVVRDSVVTGNQAGRAGGGISNAARPGTGNVTVVRTLVARNVSGGAGGGIDVEANAQGQGGLLDVRGSTIRQNLSGDGGGINAGTLTMTASTVAGNTSGSRGGGIRATTVTLTNSTVSNNSADNGGGGIIAVTATLTNSTVSGNFGIDFGGGIAADVATLTNSTVRGNTVRGGDGGGIFADTATLTGSTVDGNFAENSGGGVAAGTVTLTRSTVSNNFAHQDGGGIAAAVAATLVNSTVSGNTAALDGGGIRASGVRLLNATITGNIGRNGGGVFLAPGGTSDVRNTIVAGNLVSLGHAGPDLSGFFTSGGHNLIGDGTDAGGFADGAHGDQVGTAVDPIDPRLGPLAFNGGRTRTHALRAGSPAIDRGDGADVPATDQRGVARVRDGDGNGRRVVDIGAVER
jgi:predicted outer membrane repeat protein